MSALVIRKISASTFEASGLRSAILSTTEDGTASFLTPNDALEQKRKVSKSGSSNSTNMMNSTSGK